MGLFGISWKKIMGTAVSFGLPMVTSVFIPPVGGMIGGAVGTYLDDEIEGKPVSLGEIALGGAMGALGGGVGRLGEGTVGKGLTKGLDALGGKVPFVKNAMGKWADRGLSDAVSKLNPKELKAAEAAAKKASTKPWTKMTQAEKDQAIKAAKEKIARDNLAKEAAAKAAARNAKPWYQRKFDWNAGRAVGTGIGAGTVAYQGQNWIPTKPVTATNPPPGVKVA